MRILLVSTAFPPENSPGASRAHSFAKYWAEAGQEVTVLTTPKPESSGLALPTTGFRVLPVGHARPGAESFVRAISPSADSLPRRIARSIRQATGIHSCARMPDETDTWVRPATKAGLGAGPWDVVVSCSGPYTVHRVARRIRSAGVARSWVMDFRDLWTRNHCYPGLFPFTLVERLLERRYIRKADLVTTATTALAAELERLGAGRVQPVPNGHDPDLQPGASLTSVREDGRVRLVYTGSLYPRGQDPLPLLRALAALGRSRPDVAGRLRLVVAGPTCDRWGRLAREAGASQFLEARGVVSRLDAWTLQREASCLVVVDWSPSAAGVMTSKVYEYLFAGAPILAVGGGTDSGVARLLTETGRGHHLGRSEDLIAGFLERLARDPTSVATVRSEQVIQRYHRKTIALDLLAMLQRTAGVATGP